MTVEAILALVTSLMTYVFGVLNKKINLTDTDLIPLQNLTIGFFAGCLVFVGGIMDNLLNSIIICTISAFGAGGAYDLSKTRRGKDGDKEENIESEQDIINVEE